MWGFSRVPVDSLHLIDEPHPKFIVQGHILSSGRDALRQSDSAGEQRNIKPHQVLAVPHPDQPLAWKDQIWKAKLTGRKMMANYPVCWVVYIKLIN